MKLKGSWNNTIRSIIVQKSAIRPMNNSKNKLNSKKTDFLSNIKCTVYNIYIYIYIDS